MTVKELIIYLGAVIATQAVKDNLPNLHYKKVIATLKRVYKVCYLITFLLLVRAGIIKLSPKSLLILTGTALFILLMGWIEQTRNSNQDRLTYA